MMERVRVGDEVVVRSGADKGKRGAVLRKVSNERVVVENVRISRKHKKAQPDRGIAGGVIDQEMPIHISNLMLFNPNSGRGDRVGFKLLGDGRKVRIFKSDGELVGGG
jgi:large subunit ribosomal protein L24